jgi:hypothetical protein
MNLRQNLINETGDVNKKWFKPWKGTQFFPELWIQ